MGLDQYAGIKNYTYHYDIDDKDFSYTNVGPFEWRKHARLQEFMHRLYLEKTGKEASKDSKKKWVKVDGNLYPDQFGTLELISEDINKLEQAVRDGYADYDCDGGFFWGHQNQEYDAGYYFKQDLRFIDTARKLLKRDLKVYYRESW